MKKCQGAYLGKQQVTSLSECSMYILSFSFQSVVHMVDSHSDTWFFFASLTLCGGYLVENVLTQQYLVAIHDEISKKMLKI